VPASSRLPRGAGSPTPRSSSRPAALDLHPDGELLPRRRFRPTPSPRPPCPDCCRMDLPGPTTSVGTRTDYSVGPWDYSACATRHLMA
jgi:hypothetical protein